MDQARDASFKSARFKAVDAGLAGIFRKYARVRLLVQLINQSILA